MLIQCPAGKAGAYTIPESVTLIKGGAFSVCASLTDVTVPAGVISIGDVAFSSCASLSGVYFRGNAPRLSGASLFLNSSNATLYYRPGTTGYELMLGGRPTVLLPFTYTITNDAITLTTYTGAGGAVILPDSIEGRPVTRLADQIFDSCSGLTSVSIPKNVINIGSHAFRRCPNLAAITVDESNAVYRSVEGALCSKSDGKALITPILVRRSLRKDSAAIAPPPQIASSALAGTWELVDISAYPVIDSPPRGLAAHKYYFTPEGKLYVIEHDAELTTNTECVAYTFRNAVLTLSLPEQGRINVPVQFTAPDQMVLVHGARHRWTYRRLSGEKAYNQKIEPRSVAVLQTKDPKRQLTNLDIHYDSGDYSRLAPAERIMGVWEATSYSGISSADWPPYGFPNEKWVFTRDGKYYIIAPEETAVVGKPHSNYTVSRDHLTLSVPGETPATRRISFNTWGHLVVEWNGVTVTLKLLDKNPGKIEKLPVKIALLKAKGG
jgi:hypothetical protein